MYYRLLHRPKNEEKRKVPFFQMSLALDNIIVFATFSIVLCHAVLNSLRLVIGSVYENPVTKNNSRHFSVSLPVNFAYHHQHNPLSWFIGCDQELELVDIYVGLEEKVQLKSYEVPRLPYKEKHVPVLQKSWGFLIICDMQWDQYVQITDHFHLKPISQFREGKLVMPTIHSSFYTLKLKSLFPVNYSVN